MQRHIPEPSVRLTPRQLEILRVVASFESSRCYSPTIAELASELCISRSTVFEHIGELRAKGLLSACPGRTRSLKLTGEAQELLSRIEPAGYGTCSSRREEVRLAGRVAAGIPIEAVENVDCLSFGSCFGNGDDIFALEVAGDSMVEEDIRDGDYIVCRRTSVAENGQLVVASVDKERATVKRLYKENGTVRLQPANESYEPIYSRSCRIEAVVVGLIRRFRASRIV